MTNKRRPSIISATMRPLRVIFEERYEGLNRFLSCKLCPFEYRLNGSADGAPLSLDELIDVVDHAQTHVLS